LLKNASPKIKDASVQLVAWNKMRLNIEENPAVGYYQSDDKHYELLADGQIIEVEADAIHYCICLQMTRNIKHSQNNWRKFQQV